MHSKPMEGTNHVSPVPLVPLQNGEHEQKQQLCEIPRNSSQHLHVTSSYLAIVVQHRNSISFSCSDSYSVLHGTQLS